MHIPENYLSPTTCAAMGAVMLPIWYKAVKEVKVKVDTDKKTIRQGRDLSSLPRDYAGFWRKRWREYL